MRPDEPAEVPGVTGRVLVKKARGVKSGADPFPIVMRARTPAGVAGVQRRLAGCRVGASVCQRFSPEDSHQRSAQGVGRRPQASPFY